MYFILLAETNRDKKSKSQKREEPNLKVTANDNITVIFLQPTKCTFIYIV